MTEQQLADLDALAAAATPGPWHVAYEGSSDWTVFDEKANIHVADVHRHRAVDCPDARFIAAANPQTVLALVAEVRRLRGLVREAWDESANVPWACTFAESLVAKKLDGAP